MQTLIAVVDDDISVRESLESLIRSAGMEVRVFASAEEFLNAAHPRKADCLVLDVRLPGMNGFELQHHLLARKCEVPVIFMTAHGYDGRAKSQLPSPSTIACLTKPFSEEELLDALEAASKWVSSEQKQHD
ncbi:MAG TPA: response regulator [Dongiaceae bacterium]|nr:response regulator [Dongiaceae bacterium]